jgi:hexosaminidase
MKKYLFLLIISATATATFAGTILPKPVVQEINATAPHVNILGAKIAAAPAFAGAAEQLKTQLGVGGATVIHLVQVTGSVRNFELGPEGYGIEVTPKGEIVISAQTEAGAFYGTISLLQLADRRADGLWVPAVVVLDQPRFSWRGVLIDEGRHFMGKPEILRMLDLMSLHKLNVLHWHLTEDQGWRVEIKKWPKLTTVGSQRASSPQMGNRLQSDGLPYGGFYTQDDLREVVAHAAKLHITVVPEIEMPGHAAAAIAAYPQLGNTDIPHFHPQVITSWGIKHYIFAPKEETFAFIDDVLAELCPIFPGAYFHIGGDEAAKSQWEASPFAAEVMRREHRKDAHELQAYFIGRVEKLLTARGKKLIGWDEIQEGGLSKTATMMVWRDWKWAQLAAELGNPIVMAPKSHTYINFSQGVTPDDPRFDCWGGLLTLEQVYSFEPIPPAFTAAQQKLVLGCQAQLWSEYIYNGAKLEYMAFPRLCALAEVAWSSQASRSWPEFKGRLDEHLKRLDLLKVNYRREDGSPAVTDRLGRGE